MNAYVLLGALGVTLLATLLAGVLPAVRASRVPLARILKEGGARGGGTLGSSRLRRSMVVGELALALTLLVSAGLAVRGVQRQLASEPGFDAAGLLSFTVRLPEARYGDEALVEAYFQEATDRLVALPGVRSATIMSRLPLGAGGLSLGRSFVFDGALLPPDGPDFGAAWVEVDPDYFETLGIRPVEGRALAEPDRADAPPVAMVNERMAGLMSQDEPIVGRVIRTIDAEDPPRTVVGVLPDLQLNGVSRPQRIPAVFVPRAQSVRRSMAFLVRTGGDPAGTIPTVRSALTDLDPDVAIEQIRPLREAHAADLGGIQFLTVLFGAFGTFALVLAVSGIYGVVAYSMSQRSKEFAVRIAVGAQPSSLQVAAIRESAVLAGIGLAIGSVGAFGAGRVLENGMSGVATLETSTFVGIGSLLVAAVLLATWIPAARAAGVHPMAVLRAD